MKKTTVTSPQRHQKYKYNLIDNKINIIYLWIFNTNTY